MYLEGVVLGAGCHGHADIVEEGHEVGGAPGAAVLGVFCRQLHVAGGAALPRAHVQLADWLAHQLLHDRHCL